MLRKTKSVVLCFYTGVSVPNDVSCSGDAFLRRRLRCPDDMNSKGYFEFTREFFLLFTLQSQKPDIPVDRVFLHRYLEFMSVTITDSVQVAQKEYSSNFHISVVSSANGACIKFLSGAKIPCRRFSYILLPRSALSICN